MADLKMLRAKRAAADASVLRAIERVKNAEIGLAKARAAAIKADMLVVRAEIKAQTK